MCKKIMSVRGFEPGSKAPEARTITTIPPCIAPTDLLKTIDLKWSVNKQPIPIIMSVI